MIKVQRDTENFQSEADFKREIGHLDLTKIDPIIDPDGTVVLLAEKPEEMDLTSESTRGIAILQSGPEFQQILENSIQPYQKGNPEPIPDDGDECCSDPRITSPVLDCLFPVHDCNAKIPNSTEILHCCHTDPDGTITTPPVDRPWDAPDWMVALERGMERHCGMERHYREITPEDLAMAHAEHGFYEAGLCDPDSEPIPRYGEAETDAKKYFSNLYCPEHVFGPPDGAFTGTIIKIGKPGNYRLASRGDHEVRIDLQRGTYKVYTNPDGSHRLVIASAEEEISFRVKSHLRLAIRQNLEESTKVSRGGLNRKRAPVITPEELQAQNTLRDMLTETEWRRYVTNAFIMVRGESGLWYQVSPFEKIRIFQNNKRIGTLCIHTDNACPPTDHVVNMKLLIELDEASFRASGNFTPESRSFRDNPWFAPRHVANNQYDAEAADLLGYQVPDDDADVTEEGIRTLGELIDSAFQNSKLKPQPNLIEIAKQMRQNLTRHGVDTEQSITNPTGRQILESWVG